jgi:predicted RNA-binding Zn-ribbon protein involved in translation (DUF1610 family)
MKDGDDNNVNKADDTLGGRVLVWVLFLGFIGYIAGAGYGGYIDYNTIANAIVSAVLMGIAPFVLIPVIRLHGFGIVLVVAFIISSLFPVDDDYSSIFILVRYASIGAFLGAFVGSMLGLIIEGLKPKKDNAGGNIYTSQNNDNYIYECPECGISVSQRDKVCSNCGVELDWEDN